MTRVVEAVKVALALFFAAVLQVSIFASVDVLGGTPDLLLVTVVAVALLRGSVYGAAGGFLGGFVADTATLETLGLSSLVLTLAGYWVGRYGETTGRDRVHAPLLSVAVVTVLFGIGLYVLHFTLGDDVSARRALVEGVPPAILFNALLTVPVYAACRRLLRQAEVAERVPTVKLLG
jgi:rod shape-determining protein MreD